MIFNGFIAFLVGVIVAALTVVAKIGPLSGILVLGAAIVAFCVLEGVRKAHTTPGA